MQERKVQMCFTITVYIVYFFSFPPPLLSLSSLTLSQVPTPLGQSLWHTWQEERQVMEALPNTQALQSAPHSSLLVAR